MKAILARHEMEIHAEPMFLFTLSKFFKVNKTTILKWMQDADLTEIEEGKIEMMALMSYLKCQKKNYTISSHLKLLKNTLSRKRI